MKSLRPLRSPRFNHPQFYPQNQTNKTKKSIVSPVLPSIEYQVSSIKPTCFGRLRQSVSDFICSSYRKEVPLFGTSTDKAMAFHRNSFREMPCRRTPKPSKYLRVFESLWLLICVTLSKESVSKKSLWSRSPLWPKIKKPSTMPSPANSNFISKRQCKSVLISV